jgi:NAD-dependent SIR2 family protein deacetylase
MIASNQRLTGVLVINCRNSEVSILDSAVISSRSLRVVDCDNVTLFCEDVDLRRVELFRCRNCTVTVVGDDVLLKVLFVLTREGCSNNHFTIGDYVRGDLEPPQIAFKQTAAIPDSTEGSQYFTSVPYPEQIDSRLLTIGGSLTAEGLRLQTSLATFTLPTVFRSAELFAADRIPTGDDLLAAVAALEAAPYEVTPEQIAAQYDAERAETFGGADELRPAVRKVALLLKKEKYCVVYTGAGVSTSANIPDYRGPTGVWTLQDKGEEVHERPLGGQEILPTYAHYAITELVRRGRVRFVVTTNLDGLHWRTGLPPHLLEELHGSAFKLYCENCGSYFYCPYLCMDYVNTHETGEECEWCKSPLVDTVVMFSEAYRSPVEELLLRHHAEKADLAIVLGTSLCVQSAAMYPTLAVEKGDLVIVNGQQTPLDNLSSVRVYARTDLFCELLMEELGIQAFDQTTDVLTRLLEANTQ